MRLEFVMGKYISRKKISLRIRVWHIALLFLVVGIVIGIFGPIFENETTGLLSRYIGDFYPNIATDLTSISITILVINTLYQCQAKEQEKRMLISQLASPFNVLARDAARILRDKGWHKDLGGIPLYRANLEDAELYDFVLPGANLTYANLRNSNLNGAILDGVELVPGDDGGLEGALFHRAILRKANIASGNGHLIFKNSQFVGTDLLGAKFLGVSGGIMTESVHPHLQATYCMRDSIMPNGKRYDGRYNLPGDLAVASYNRDASNPSIMAEFYGVSIEEYRQGQAWHVTYEKYMTTLERKARALCIKKGLYWDGMNEDLRGKFVDTFLKEP